MIIPKIAKYVESMRNIGYLTGFVRHLDKIPSETWHKRQLKDFHGFLLQQTANLEQAIPIWMPDGVPMPADKSPVTVAVHVFGYKDATTGEQSIKVKSLDIARPSIRAMPPSMVWKLDSNAKFADDDFNPFGKGGDLKPEYADAVDKSDNDFSDAEKAIQQMLEASRGRLDTRLGQNANVIMVAGFLDSFTKFLPDEFRTQSFWDLRIRQHEERDRALPVRVYTRDIKGLGSKLRRGLPTSVTGQIRVKVTPNDEKDGIPEGVVYIRTDDIYGADRINDILKVPEWYVKMREEHERERQAQKEALRRRVDPSLLEGKSDDKEARRKELLEKMAQGASSGE